jgi:hypothetical protein
MPKPKKAKTEKLGLSKFIKKTKPVETERANTYVFKGFFERLQKIDVKNANMDSFKYDHLLEDAHGNALDDDDTMQSNFIVLLAAEKLNNPTVEFKRVHHELLMLAGSLPLIVLNQQKLLTKMLGYL